MVIQVQSLEIQKVELLLKDNSLTQEQDYVLRNYLDCLKNRTCPPKSTHLGKIVVEGFKKNGKKTKRK